MGVFAGRLEAIAADAEDIPTLREVAWKVLKTVSDRSNSLGELERLLKLDQALTGKILRLANFRPLPPGTAVTTLQQAIAVLGKERLRSVVLAASIDGLVGSRALKNRRNWDHALAAGLAAESLAKSQDGCDPGHAFVCGLMHDLGKVVLDRSLGAEYQPVLDLVYNEQVSFREAERRVLGFDHTEVGSLVAEKWRLPWEIQDAVRHHHDPAMAQLPTLSSVVSLADALCLKQGIGPCSFPDLDFRSLEAWQRLSLDTAFVDGVSRALPARCKAERLLFGLN